MTKLPKVAITRSGAGWLVTCSCGWERHETRRPGADKAAHDHARTHARRDA